LLVGAPEAIPSQTEQAPSPHRAPGLTNFTIGVCLVWMGPKLDAVFSAWSGKLLVNVLLIF